MPTKGTTVDSSERQAAYWRGRYEKQKLVINSIISLLNKYGCCLDLHSLYREFVLTLMGHYALSDACYFTAHEESEMLQPAVAYGANRLQNLQPIDMDSAFVSKLQDANAARKLADLPMSVLRDSSLEQLRKTMIVTAPLCLGERLLGIVFLGPKITRRRFTESDLDLLNTLSAASAITFNNARLFENVKSSMDEVQRLSDLREEMIARIGHEFRTPLTAIKAAISCLPDSDKTGSMPEIMANAADRLQGLIESLLILNTKSEATETKAVYDPTTPIYEFISDHGQEAMAKNLTFEVKALADTMEVSLAVSRENFVNVVERLLKNAVKFSREGSTIGVGLEIVSREPDEAIDGELILNWRDQTEKTIGEYKNLIEHSFNACADAPQPAEEAPSVSHGGDYLVLRVIDKGIGIPKEELQFIGEPFRQASNSPDQRVKGKALGLAVVQKILSDCHGRLCCKSEQDVGSTFSVFFPVV